MAPRKVTGPLVDGEEVLTPQTRSTLPKSPASAPTTPTGPRATVPGRGIAPIAGARFPEEDVQETNKALSVPAGFTPGSLPTELQAFFGNEPDVVGYKIINNPDGTISVEVARSGGGTSGYGAKLRSSGSGSYSIVPSAGGGTGGETATTETSNVDPETQRRRVSAKASLEAWLKTFFDATKDSDVIRSMMSFVDQQVTADIPEDAIMINIREQQFYKARFKGNEGLRAAGMAELDPADYLRAERQYADILNAANLNTLAQRDTFASLIGGQVSAVELEDRVTNVYQRIKNADTALKDEMARLNQLGNITSADFAAALLTGKEGAASLRRKIAQAEVSTEFTQRGLTSAMGIEELANLGVTREQARQGAEYARMGTQRLTTLGSIYGVQSAEIQRELEQEAFKGLESQRRKQLTAQERAAFAGSAGTGMPSLGSSAAGAI